MIRPVFVFLVSAALVSARPSIAAGFFSSTLTPHVSGAAAPVLLVRGGGGMGGGNLGGMAGGQGVA